MRTSTAASWQSYWQQADEKKACKISGTDHPAISQFWHKFFSDARVGAKSAPDNLRVVDVASGRGAVFEHLFALGDGACCDAVCVDLSHDALGAVRDRWPAVSGIVANGAALPIAEHSVDIVVSQFGVEYAGVDAVVALCKLVRPGGQLALLLHHRGGAIFKECDDNYVALCEVQKSGFLQGAMNMFPHAFNVLAGGERSEYERTSKSLIPAFRIMERIMAQYGRNVASGVVRKLYLDIDHIHTNLPAFDRQEVDVWLRQASRELQYYTERMNSMRHAALDDQQFEVLKAEMADFGFELHVADALAVADHSAPLAWSVIAEKAQNNGRGCR